MVAELRKIGSQVVLFTNEAPIYRRLNGLSLTNYKVPYLQNGKVVGIDFYFDRSLRKTAQKVKDGQLLLGI
jgi:hypothetical protein